MPTYRAQVVLMMDTGLSEDAATNTWYFNADNADGFEEARVALNQYYIDIGTRISSLVDIATSRVKWYDVANPQPSGPVMNVALTGVTTGATAWPTEVALVMSYGSDVPPGSPPARHLGRVFIGPLASNAGDRPVAAVVEDIRDAGAALLLSSQGSTSEFTWMQYSPTAASYSEVTRGWVDNDWDTQRRRGRKPTSRTNFGST